MDTGILDHPLPVDRYLGSKPHPVLYINRGFLLNLANSAFIDNGGQKRTELTTR